MEAICIRLSSRLLPVLDVVRPSLCDPPLSLYLTDPPTVTLSIEPRSVLEGDRVTFTCQAHANPPIMGYRSVRTYKHIVLFTWPLKVAVTGSKLYGRSVCISFWFRRICVENVRIFKPCFWQECPFLNKADVAKWKACMKTLLDLRKSKTF